MSQLPPTERINSATQGLDMLDSLELATVLAAQQQAAVDAVKSAARQLAIAIDEIAARLRAGGTLHYLGAGTSGRLGFLDASEMPPTFGTPPSLVRAHIAGGLGALTTAVEGAEDDAQAGLREAQEHVRSGDALIGISASGGAPYVVAAVAAAREAGAWTAGITSVAGSKLAQAAHVAIVLETGAEPLTGSTRLKAGTAQKIALNTISTGVMVRLGKVYDNLMVDVVATNAKLRDRAVRLVQTLTGLEAPAAKHLLEQANGRVKIAAAMHACGVDAPRANELLESSGGSLRAILGRGYKPQ